MSDLKRLRELAQKADVGSGAHDAGMNCEVCEAYQAASRPAVVLALLDALDAKTCPHIVSGDDGTSHCALAEMRGMRGGTDSYVRGAP